MEQNDEFLASLRTAYENVVHAPKTHSFAQIRNANAQYFLKIFSDLGVQIMGSENLPYEQGSIFIYNHLTNDPSLIAAENFQITLDSHFISSLLYKYYNAPGIRVTRHALPEEKAHQDYYDRLGYIRVYARDFTPSHLDSKEIKKTNGKFYSTAAEVLKNNTSLIFSPEGSSLSTAASPGSFREGIFKLASRMNPQPKIVPVVMANFDKLPHKTNYKCQIMPSFKMSDYGIHSDQDENLGGIVNGIEKQYKTWIKKLVHDKGNFTREISVLQRRANHKKSTSDLLVFYGSSTIRLWNSLASDFPQHNTLNLGFGGAFIHSLSTHFDALFNGLQPKAIFLYLGGNDLSLHHSAKEIVSRITAFINRIYQKFPRVMVYNISIKPSYERQKDLPMIEEINAAMEELAKTTPQLQQLNLFDQLVQQGKIRKDVLLQDGLHLNANGYKILKGLVHKALLEKYY